MGREIGKFRRWIADMYVGGLQKAILHTLVNYINDDHTCYPGIARIAKESGVSERSAQKFLRELEASGALVIQRSSGRTTNRYRLMLNSKCAAVSTSHGATNPAHETGSNPEPCAGLNDVNPAYKAVLNPAHGAGYVNSNPARQVVQPRTVRTLLDRTEEEEAREAEEAIREEASQEEDYSQEEHHWDEESYEDLDEPPYTPTDEDFAMEIDADDPRSITDSPNMPATQSTEMVEGEERFRV